MHAGTDDDPSKGNPPTMQIIISFLTQSQQQNINHHMIETRKVQQYVICRIVHIEIKKEVKD